MKKRIPRMKCKKSREMEELEYQRTTMRNNIAGRKFMPNKPKRIITLSMEFKGKLTSRRFKLPK